MEVDDIIVLLAEECVQATLRWERPQHLRRCGECPKCVNTVVMVSVLGDLVAVLTQEFSFVVKNSVFTTWLLIVIVNEENPHYANTLTPNRLLFSCSGNTVQKAGDVVPVHSKNAAFPSTSSARTTAGRTR